MGSMKLFREPFVQFVLLGALLFLAYNFSQSAENTDAERRIVVDAQTQDWIYSNFTKQFRRPPSRVEMGALVQAHIRQEVKYREALSMDLDQGDSIVIRRMTQKFDFLFGGAAGDVVPEDSVLRDWHDSHKDAYTIPRTIDFRHVWFSPDRRGSTAEEDALTALAMLRSGETAAGDPFPLQSEFADATGLAVRNVLGPEFSDAIFEAPVAQWSGPYKTGLGYHLVMVLGRTEKKTVPFEEIREVVLQDWRDLKSSQILEDMIEALESEYVIEIDESALSEREYAPSESVVTP